MNAQREVMNAQREVMNAQREVMENLKIAWGTSLIQNKEIAVKLGKSEATVSKFRMAIMKGETLKTNTVEKLCDIFKI